VKDPVEVTLTLEHTEPADGEVAAEPNGFICLYFKRPIDIDKLELSLYETAPPGLHLRGGKLLGANY
jgi:hypothetical protein